MDNNIAKQKYLKYKYKYLQLKQMREELGLGEAEGGFNPLAAAASVLKAVTDKVKKLTTCVAYYNKDSNGYLNNCYNFESPEGIQNFLKDKIMKGNSTQNPRTSTPEQINNRFEPNTRAYENTILHELVKANFIVSKMPKLAQLFMKLRLCETNLLELCFDKKNTIYYKSLLDGIIVSTLVSQNIITSIKDLLFLNKQSYDINIWDAYSDLLCFLRCINDSNVATGGITVLGRTFTTINTIVLENLKNLQLPVNIVFLEEIFKNNNFNLQDLYTNDDGNIIRPTPDVIEAYNNINYFTLEDFFDVNKNTKHILPPSVLILLSLKFNTETMQIKPGSWGQTIQTNLGYFGQCGTKTLEEFIKTYEHLILQEENPMSKSVIEKVTTLQELQTELQELINKNSLEMKQYETKCSVQKSKGFVNTTKAIFSKLKFNVLKNDNTSTESDISDTQIDEDIKCAKYYKYQDTKHKLEDQIKNIQSKTEKEFKKQFEPFGPLFAKFIRSLAGLTDFNTIACTNPQNIIWKSFDGILNNYYGLVYNDKGDIKRDLSKYNFIKYTILFKIAGSATFLPLDFTKLLHHLLGIKEKRQTDFDYAYDIYRIDLYKNYVGYRNSKQKEYRYDNNQFNRLPLFPPIKLLNTIKEKLIIEEKK